ncbi:MAG: zinc ABC transporter substrate-binding protein [Thermoleophilaceae bacterium]|nr:zinc ABC transporter substrate-binding protein [Thermoleophilaceae bacterium]
MPAWQLATVALAAAEGVLGLWLSVRTNAPPGATIAATGGVGFALAALARALRPGRRVAPVAALAAGLLAVGALGGCAGAGTSSGGRLLVVATTTQLGDFAREVGGRDVQVHQILRPSTDPHDYEPRPRDVLATADARLVLASGDGLDRWIDDVVDDAGGAPSRLDLATRVPVRRGADPHWWHDPRNAEAAVAAIRDALVAAEPAHRSAYERNAADYLARLRALDAGIARCLSAIPPADRKLVTDHDAFGYFAARYGLRVVGAVIPSQATDAQSSGSDVSKLVDTIRREHVRAIFPESAVSPKLARAIARETGATPGGELRGDTLGPEGSAAATYLGMERANADAIARGLSGGRLRCRLEAGA